MTNGFSETFWEIAARTKMGSYLTKMETEFFTRGINFPDCKLVCDIGAGAGKFSMLATQKNIETVALDIDICGLRRLKMENGTVHVILADAKALPMKPSTVDAAFAIEVVDYIPELGEVLSECHRIMKNGGSLVVSFGNQSSLKSKIRQLQGKKYSHSFHEVALKLGITGFRIVKKQGFNWLPFNRTSENMLIPLLAKIERVLGLRRIARYSPWVLISAKLEKE